MTTKQKSSKVLDLSEFSACTACSTPPEVPKASSKSFNSYSDLISSCSIEHILATNGYKPEEVVIVSNNLGKKKAKLVKAINKYGNTVYVFIDIEGYISTKDNDACVKQTSRCVVDESITGECIDCVSSDIHGVAFVCENGICTKTHTLDADHEVLHFANVSAPDDYQANTQAIIYPVIKISEIKESPDEVLEGTKQAIKRLRNQEIEKAHAELPLLEKQLSNFDNALKSYVVGTKLFTERLVTSLNDFNEVNEKHLATPMKSCDDHEKYKKVMKNLVVRNKMLDDLLLNSRRINDIQRSLEEYTNELEIMQKKLDEDLVLVDQIL